MGTLDTVIVNPQTSTHSVFSKREALAIFYQLGLKDQTQFIAELTLQQANEVLLEVPLGKVQDILEHLEDNGYSLKARELSATFGLMISEAQPSCDYLKAGVLEHVKARLGWIVGLSLLGIVSGMIIASYEDALSALVILAIYMPVMADTGGNVGSQAATLIVRSLATGELNINDWARVLWKEIRVAIIMASALMLVIMVRVVGFGSEMSLPAGITLTQVGLAVSIAMAIQVISSTVIGSMLPIVARTLRLDPAVLVSPVLTSIVDISGMLIYFYTVTQALGL